MQQQPPDGIWLDERETISLTELSGACGLSVEDVNELVEYGALAPLATAPPEWVFSALCVTPLRTAGRLRQDFDLDLFTVAMLLGYLHRIEALENELRCLQAGQPPASVAIAGEFRTLV